MKLLILGLALVATAAAQSGASTNCPCGWSNKGRIVGGREAQKNAYPLVAAMALMIDGEPTQAFCGATILTPYHAITAAHCTQSPITDYLSYVKLLVGAHNTKNLDAGTQAIAVEKMIDHENYVSRDKAGVKNPNDISILVLAEPIKYNQNVGPACLPTGPIDLDSQYIRLLGWGLTATGGDMSEVLNEVDLQVLPYKKCSSIFPLNKEQSQLCTFAKNKDSCKGDSGGPLIHIDPETSRYTLVGLVSYGSKDCGTRPAVNTDVTRYVSWIQAKISESGKPGTTCQKVKLVDMLDNFSL